MLGGAIAEPDYRDRRHFIIVIVGRDLVLQKVKPCARRPES